MEERVAEVAYDGRFDVWVVDLYEHDSDVGADVHVLEEGRYDVKREAVGAAEGLAAARGALLRVEDEGGSVVEERYP